LAQIQVKANQIAETTTSGDEAEVVVVEDVAEGGGTISTEPEILMLAIINRIFVQKELGRRSAKGLMAIFVSDIFNSF